MCLINNKCLARDCKRLDCLVIAGGHQNHQQNQAERREPGENLSRSAYNEETEASTHN